MKIFNVALQVTITQIAELPDNPPTAPFNDDPLKKVDQFFERAERIMAPRPPMIGMVGYGSDGASITQNVRIQAETYEDLQAVLRMFADTVKAIHKVPDSILKDAAPSFG